MKGSSLPLHPLSLLPLPKSWESGAMYYWVVGMMARQNKSWRLGVFFFQECLLLLLHCCHLYCHHWVFLYSTVGLFGIASGLTMLTTWMTLVLFLFSPFFFFSGQPFGRGFFLLACSLFLLPLLALAYISQAYLLCYCSSTLPLELINGVRRVFAVVGVSPKSKLRLSTKTMIKA